MFNIEHQLNNTMTKSKERNSNVETLRVLMMYLIVLLHFFARVFDLGNPDKYSPFIFSAIQGIRCICFLGVSTFAFISGYYGIKWSLKKFLKYEILATIWEVVFYAMGMAYEGANLKMLFPLSSGYHWYFSAYMILMILAPVLNKGMESLSKEQLKTVCVFLVLIHYAGQFLFPGSIGSEFLILVVIYVLAFYMRKYPVQYFEKHALFIFCTSLLLNIAIAMAAGKYLDYTIEAWQAKLLSKFATNNNPLVIISSVSLFFYIKNLKTYRFRSIARFAPYMFSVYIIHCCALGIGKFEELLYINSFTFLFLSTILVVISCSFAEYIRQKLMGNIENKFIEAIVEKLSKQGVN